MINKNANTTPGKTTPVQPVTTTKTVAPVKPITVVGKSGSGTVTSGGNILQNAPLTPAPVASMVYYQGLSAVVGAEDCKLYRVNPDGTGTTNVGGYQCKSAPVVYGNYIYFQGIDNKLCQCQLDGSNLQNIGGNTMSSAPSVNAVGVFYQGTDNQLWCLNPDTAKEYNVGGGNKTITTPAAYAQYVFFVGTDNQLWRINYDGTGQISVGGNTAKTTPFVIGQYVFFQGTDNKLWRIDIDGKNGINLGGGYETISTPYATDEYVFFQGTDNKLWRINIDGTGGVNIAGLQCKSSPAVDTTQNVVYFQGIDNKLCKCNLDGSGLTVVGAANSQPFVVQQSNQPQTGSATQSYLPLLLVYSPPGSSAQKAISNVIYANTVTNGTTYTNTKVRGWSFGASLSLSDKGSGNSTNNGSTTSNGGNGNNGTGTGTGSGSGSGNNNSDPLGGTGASFTISDTDTDSTSLLVQTSSANAIQVNGPLTDGIDHGEDQIWIWLSPTMNIILDPSYCMNWGLSVTGDEGTNIIFIKMSWLMDLDLFQTENSDGYSRCITAGMTNADFEYLLTLNPFANDASAPIDLQRYTQIDNFPGTYETTGSGAPVTLQFVEDYETVNTIVAQSSFSASLTGTLDYVMDQVAKLGFTASYNMQNNTSQTTANTQDNHIICNISGPGTGSAPSHLRGYWDNLFGTIMFNLFDEVPQMKGIMTEANGQVAANVEVELQIDGQTFYTYTDSNGNYAFYNIPAGNGTVTIVPPVKKMPGGTILRNLNATEIK